MQTETGLLVYGIEYPAGSGQIHHQFEMRLPTVGDNITAIEAHGVDSNLKLNVDMMARCLVKLGNIPAEQINYELLAAHLVDEDYDVLVTARETLKKKRRTSSSTSTACASPSSPSAATASAKAG